MSCPISLENISEEVGSSTSPLVRSEEVPRRCQPTQWWHMLIPTVAVPVNLNCPAVLRSLEALPPLPGMVKGVLRDLSLGRQDIAEQAFQESLCLDVWFVEAPEVPLMMCPSMAEWPRFRNVILDIRCNAWFVLSKSQAAKLADWLTFEVEDPVEQVMIPPPVLLLEYLSQWDQVDPAAEAGAEEYWDSFGPEAQGPEALNPPSPAWDTKGLPEQWDWSMPSKKRQREEQEDDEGGNLLGTVSPSTIIPPTKRSGSGVLLPGEKLPGSSIRGRLVPVEPLTSKDMSDLLIRDISRQSELFSADLAAITALILKVPGVLGSRITSIAQRSILEIQEVIQGLLSLVTGPRGRVDFPVHC